MTAVTIFPQITGLFTGILTFLFVGLTLRVVQLRRRDHENWGDAADSDLNIAIRTHANFAEFVPLALLLLGLCEASFFDSGILYALGGLLTLARFAHAHGMYTKTLATRGAGLMLTNLVIVIGSVLVLQNFFAYGGSSVSVSIK
mmetsp:Transcript_9908/g.11247  ORF Transcript_9908/g.11247 Transcript_9908/m.11247 type:complete len:144 (-) Transcript_9908:246-677(-)|eukprot:CAMPEP_0176432442 /NCGR_PEP_ID=MMETSP0127-20121128/15399_1 /TAXON_ID=938130 /ORGANISM="Platyophrya macrostoma, Strain WH" /LENGTH=143 /DNA_ID=CAMNT_0017814619 /DNA_START=35 /DNA_END=466 /DNA_ORIENTATION=+